MALLNKNDKSINEVVRLFKIPRKTLSLATQSITLQHPLVTTGLIPPTLADILLTPTVENKKKKNTQVIVKERVLTSEEWREKIADKERERELKEKRSAEWKKKGESNSNKRKDKASV